MNVTSFSACASSCANGSLALAGQTSALCVDAPLLNCSGPLQPPGWAACLDCGSASGCGSGSGSGTGTGCYNAPCAASSRCLQACWDLHCQQEGWRLPEEAASGDGTGMSPGVQPMPQAAGASLLLWAEGGALLLLIALTVGGNLLVVCAVARSPTLRLPTHALVANLAVADLLLGTAVLPLSAARELWGAWPLGAALCTTWTALDVLCCTASILSLCAISVDRYVGVSRPLSYGRILTRRRVRALIAATWLLALAISVAQPLGWREGDASGGGSGSGSGSGECHVNKQLGYVIFSAAGSFYLPALVILALYALVYRAASRHEAFLQAGQRTTRSAVTLRVHLGAPGSRRGTLAAHDAADGKVGRLPSSLIILNMNISCNTAKHPRLFFERSFTDMDFEFIH
ncbi:alpha-1A adrenergic receptor-like [Schistocerca serialis cubense]|uniref:alpha-1A adrenergic receptor-like n=1 Tax=Schistocerca serialis cubense TaxID=2023355 RepID=UPI00214E6683|nr:alpha-1A adrenergic receptor-like [Schistocerca serialis cubense]